ncbi:MAG: hypothetical protein LBH24_06080 [Clostridiales bacterium]|nr:hypothetical protein [Clostridiales bacterium]
MKRLFKFVGVWMCAAALFGALLGCEIPDVPDPTNPGGYVPEPIDHTKSQLYISNFNGGFMTDWLYAAILRFVEDYKDYSFEPDKKGAQVYVETHKSTVSDLTPERNEIFFLESQNYYDRLSTGQVYDITEWVTTPLEEYGEDESIAGKMHDDYRAYFETANGKYYGVPHYQRYATITYDADLFDSKKLFMDTDGKFTKKSTETGRSKGPDNVFGTFDDGLPATYAEFYALCNEMKNRNVDPINWSSMYAMYTGWLTAQMKADFEGAETGLFYHFNGTATKLAESISESGTGIEKVATVAYKPSTPITTQNGYELYSSAGIYYALDFLKNLCGYATPSSLSGSVSHVGAQFNFLTSRETAERPTGMLVEGNYWVNESADTFAQMEHRYGNSSLQKRRLAVMPLPKATPAVGDAKRDTYILDHANSAAFVNSKIDASKLTLARTFFRYVHTDKSLLEYLTVSHTTKAFRFDVPADVRDGLDYYTKSALQYMESGINTIANSSNAFFYARFNDLGYGNQFKTNNYQTPISVVSNMTALQAFNEIKANHNSSTWK